jgi:hypothetical protein
MRSLADGLPDNIAEQIHPDWRKNEADYWRLRDQLILQFQNQWIGFADEEVIVAGTNAVAVLHAVQLSRKHAYFVCVGREFQPCRMRRVSFVYDMTYPGPQLPVVHVEFRTTADSIGVGMDWVIPDTGADASALPWSDCQRLQLDPALGLPGLMGGIGGGATSTLSYGLWARIDGADYPCRLNVDFVGTERIVGRDVLNQMEILFRGPACEVVFNP